MTEPVFTRVTSYGRPVLKGLDGSLWQHNCGIIENVDLLDAYGGTQPWGRPCVCGGNRGQETWRPLYAYTGPTCDQCAGNGWVPISGKVDGAPCGYDTVTECTACAGMGWGI